MSNQGIPENPDLKRLDKDVEVEIFDAIRGPGEGNPVLPARLRPEDSFCFSCHKDIPCWNACCHGADVTLTPMDILGLSRHLGIRLREFLTEYTLPAIWDKANLPVAKLKMSGADGKGPCMFMVEEGCSVYDARPVTCRYYPLGLASVKPKGADHKEDFYFLVKESHCEGHDEDNRQTVSDFRQEQGIDVYDRVNRGWMDIVMKMASWRSLGGPYGKDLSTQVKKMFFMVSTDVDALRTFILETKFLESYEVDAEAVEAIKTDDEVLLSLGFDWMKNVMFNEPTVSLKEPVLREAISKARENMGAT